MTKPTGKLSIVVFITMLLAGHLTTAFGHEVNFSCPAAFGNAPDASGLIAYYPFDGNAADASGNGLNAIKVNATMMPGKMGQGYYFNGKRSYIRLPIDITPTVYPQITLTAWIKPTSTKGTRYIFNQGNRGNRGLFISNGNVTGAAGKSLMGQGRHAIYANRWTFVALTYDQKAGTATLLSDVYISATNATLPETSRPTILLGAKSPGKSGFEGIIDEVRVYNRVLSTTELAGIKNGSSPTAVAAGSGKSKQLLPGAQAKSSKSKQFPGTQAKSGKSRQLPGTPANSGQSKLPPKKQSAAGKLLAPSTAGQGSSSSRTTANSSGSGSSSNTSSSSGSGSSSGGTRTTRQTQTAAKMLVYAPGAALRTGVSGLTGGITWMLDERSIVGFGARLGTRRITIGEKGDRPCYIKSEIGIADSCKGSVNNKKYAGLSRSYRVTALRVCTRKKNNRVKGLSIRGQKLTATGLGNTYERDEVSLPNCKGNWQKWVQCPSGQIASGIKAYFVNGGNKADSLVGLQLYCRALKLVPKS